MPDAPWPDTFVYVCAPGRGAIVNRAPLFHAGLDRVRGLLLLVAVRDRSNPTQAERSEALIPETDMIRFGLETLRLPRDAIRSIDGDPDSFVPWTGAMDQACAWAHDLDCEVVFNTQGGRKPTTIGALLGRTKPRPVPHLISVGGQPLKTIGLGFDSAGHLVESTMAVARHMTIPEYLDCYGYAVKSESRPTQTEIDVASALLSLYEADPGKARAGFGTINRFLGQMQQGNNFPMTSFEVRFEKLKKYQAAGLQHIHKLCAPLGLQGPDLPAWTIPGPQVARFLHGKWLEIAIWHRAAMRIHNLHPSALATGLDYARRGSDQSETDLDLCLVARDQLHVVEVKSVTTTKYLGDTLKQVKSTRSDMLGQQGKLIWLAPLLDPAEDKVVALRERAGKAGIELLTGQRAIRTTLDQLAALI